VASAPAAVQEQVAKTPTWRIRPAETREAAHRRVVAWEPRIKEMLRPEPVAIRRRQDEEAAWQGGQRPPVARELRGKGALRPELAAVRRQQEEAA
jgi:hypothetical protein